MRRASLDLYRAARFRWITPFLTLLSMTDTASGRSASASSLLVVVCALLIEVRSSDRAALFRIRALRFWRSLL